MNYNQMQRPNIKKNSIQKPPGIQLYPEIQIEKANLEYARIMLDNIGGYNSETSAIIGYTYSNVICMDRSREASDLFLEVAKYEMKHMHIFSELAFRLGEDPRPWFVRGNRRTLWSASFIKFCPNLINSVKNAIESEKRSAARYEHQMKRIDDENIKAVFSRIIEDELKHEKMFTELYEKIR